MLLFGTPSTTALIPLAAMDCNSDSFPVGASVSTVATVDSSSLPFYPPPGPAFPTPLPIDTVSFGQPQLLGLANDNYSAAVAAALAMGEYFTANGLRPSHSTAFGIEPPNSVFPLPSGAQVFQGQDHPNLVPSGNITQIGSTIDFHTNPTVQQLSAPFGATAFDPVTATAMFRQLSNQTEFQSEVRRDGAQKFEVQLDENLAPVDGQSYKVNQLPNMTPTSPCGGCSLSIVDKSFLLIGLQSWHSSCVRCSVCGKDLEEAGPTCFARDGALYCKRDYALKFGKCCERCGVPIEKNEFVMRARSSVYHLQCFTCTFCGFPLRTGDSFTTGLERGTLFCYSHFHFNPINSIPYGLQPAPGFPTPSIVPNTIGPINSDQVQEENGTVGINECFLLEMNKKVTGLNVQCDTQPATNSLLTQKINYSFVADANANEPTPTGIFCKARGSSISGSPPTSNGNCSGYMDLQEDDPSNSAEIDDYGSSDGCTNGNGSLNGKAKRMRTSFKHHQLRTMKTYFNLNHNPDAKDLKQLAQKTGLTKRVLQVWFQNARAKFRRGNHQPRGLCMSIGNATDLLIVPQAAVPNLSPMSANSFDNRQMTAQFSTSLNVASASSSSSRSCSSSNSNGIVSSSTIEQRESSNPHTK